MTPFDLFAVPLVHNSRSVAIDVALESTVFREADVNLNFLRVVETIRAALAVEVAQDKHICRVLREEEDPRKRFTHASIKLNHT